MVGRTKLSYTLRSVVDPEVVEEPDSEAEVVPSVSGSVSAESETVPVSAPLDGNVAERHPAFEAEAVSSPRHSEHNSGRFIAFRRVYRPGYHIK